MSASVDQGTLLLNKTAGTNVAGSLTISGTSTVKLNAANQISDSTRRDDLGEARLLLNSLAETVGSLNFSGGSITSA